MPTWTELQVRNPLARTTTVHLQGDETLVADVRARMTPEHFVEEKLRVALGIESPRRRKPK